MRNGLGWRTQQAQSQGGWEAAVYGSSSTSVSRRMYGVISKSPQAAGGLIPKKGARTVDGDRMVWSPV